MMAQPVADIATLSMWQVLRSITPWEVVFFFVMATLIFFAAYSIQTICTTRRCPGCRSVRHRKTGVLWLCMACGNVFGKDDAESVVIAEARRRRGDVFVGSSDRDNAA